MTRNIVSFLVGVVLLTALLTPLVCDVLLMFNAELPFPFSRVFDRVALLVALFLVVVFRKSLGGFDRLRVVLIHEFKQWPLVMGAMALSLLSSSVVVAYYLVVGALTFDLPEGAYLLRKIPLLLPTALLIAVIEETFFRGFLLSRCRPKLGMIGSILAVSALYALVHFVAPAKTFKYVAGDWWHGWSYLTYVFERLFAFDLLAPMFGLWLVGVVLACVVVRQQSLTVAIGLHAGWIIGLKLVTYLTEWAPHLAQQSSLAKRYFIVGDVPGWLCVGVVAVCLYFFLPVVNIERINESKS